MHNLIEKDFKAIISLPPRNDTEAEIFSQWDSSGPEEFNFYGQDFIFPKGIHSEAKAKWIEPEVLLVEIFIEGEIVSSCARCLAPVSLEISGNLMYLYSTKSADSLEEDFGDEEPIELENFGRVLDIGPQIQESIFALLPRKILCNENCKGLCPSCGKNLNEGPCSCEKEISDPRLEALKQFKF